MASFSDIRRFDIEAYFRSLGFQLHQTRDEFYGDCFVCGGKNKFYINALSKKCICHKCQFRTNSLIYLIQKLTGVSSEQADDLIKGKSSEIRVRKLFDVEDTPVEITLPEYHSLLEFPTTERSQPYWDYVIGRGVRPSVVTQYKLGYCRRGKYKNRVIVPVYWRDTLVSWVGRLIKVDGNRKPKITPPGNHQSRYLFNADNLWYNSEITLVEGPFDMLKAPTLLCASFGKHLSSAQFNIIRSMSLKRVTVMYDDDAMGDTLETAAKINEITRCFVATLPPGKDPGDLNEGEIRYLIQQAEPYKDNMLIDFKLKEAQSNVR